MEKTSKENRKRCISRSLELGKAWRNFGAVVVRLTEWIPFSAEWQIATNSGHIWLGDGNDEETIAPKELVADFVGGKFAWELEEEWPNHSSAFQMHTKV